MNPSIRSDTCRARLEQLLGTDPEPSARRPRRRSPTASSTQHAGSAGSGTPDSRWGIRSRPARGPRDPPRREDAHDDLVASTVPVRAEETIGAFLPRIGACLALLVVGYLLAWTAGRIISKTLATVGFDALAERVGVSSELARIGMTVRLATGRRRRPLRDHRGRDHRRDLRARPVRAHHIPERRDPLPSEAARGRTDPARRLRPRTHRPRPRRPRDRSHGSRRAPRSLAEMAIIAIFVATALAQLSVPLAILTLIVAILIAAAAFSAALAFGLGSRDTARQIAAGRSLRARSTSASDHRRRLTGEIEAIGSAATLVRTTTSTLRSPTTCSSSPSSRCTTTRGASSPSQASDSRFRRTIHGHTRAWQNSRRIRRWITRRAAR